MKNLILFLAVAALACVPKEVVKPVAVLKPTVAAAPKPVEAAPAELYKSAREALVARDWAAASAGLEAYLAKEPKSAAANFDAGWVAEQRQQLDKAAGSYKRALELEPGHLGAALNLARVYRLWERFGDGEQVLRAALTKREGDPKLLNALATLLRLDKKTDEAEAMVRRVLVRHPDNADAYKNLALIELDRDRPRLAEVALANARKLDDKDPGTVNNQGLLALRKNDVTTARMRFDEATRLDPAFGPAWANLGSVALSYRDYQTAADAYAKATAADPSRWELQLAQAWALDGLKKPGEARAAYEKVLALKPGQDDALWGKATALKAEGKLPEAMAAFKVYAEAPKAVRVKDAQGQIAQIDLRLKNPPQKAPPPEAKKESKSGAGSDISMLALPTGAAANDPTASLPSDLPLPGIDDQLAIPASAMQPPPVPVQSAAPAQAPSALPAIPAASPAPAAATPAKAADKPADKAAPAATDKAPAAGAKPADKPAQSPATPAKGGGTQKVAEPGPATAAK